MIARIGQLMSNVRKAIGSIGPTSGSGLLMENGSFLLQENGSFIILE